jgi:tRNA threonylcarbamoyladenosine biosynthesis protein TsaB
MLVLAFDSAMARCSAGIVRDGTLLAARQQDVSRGQGSLLPVLVQELLDTTGIHPDRLDLIGVTIGPGSFTGIRSGVALAQGIALATDVPLVGVTVGEALAASLPLLSVRRLWSAIDNRRGRIFLEREGAVIACALDALPCPDGPVAIAGDAAPLVAAWLAARGADVMLTDARLPAVRHVAEVAAKRLAGVIPPRAVQPLYVEPPEARLPAGGLRPPPVA